MAPINHIKGLLSLPKTKKREVFIVRTNISLMVNKKGNAQPPIEKAWSHFLSQGKIYNATSNATAWKKRRNANTNREDRLTKTLVQQHSEIT